MFTDGATRESGQNERREKTDGKTIKILENSRNKVNLQKWRAFRFVYFLLLTIHDISLSGSHRLRLGSAHLTFLPIHKIFLHMAIHVWPRGRTKNQQHTPRLEADASICRQHHQLVYRSLICCLASL